MWPFYFGFIPTTNLLAWLVITCTFLVYCIACDLLLKKTVQFLCCTHLHLFCMWYGLVSRQHLMSSRTTCKMMPVEDQLTHSRLLAHIKPTIHEATFVAGEKTTLLFVADGHEISDGTFYKSLGNRRAVYSQATCRM